MLETLLQRHALNQEGLFRIPPPQNEFDEARNLLDKHKTPSFFASDSITNEQVNVIGGLYKYFFRHLPDPLIPFANYDSLIAAQAKKMETELLNALEVTMLKMPLPHRNTLLHLMQFVALIAGHAEVNKMTVE